MKHRILSFGIGSSILLSLLSIMPALAIPSYAADMKIAWPGSHANQSEYWEDFLKITYGGDWICKKIDEEGDFDKEKTSGAIIIKAGQWNYVWKPAPAGHYTTPQGVSHYFKCKVDKPPKPPEPKPMPELRIQIVCVAHNSGGERKVVRTRVYYDTDGVQMVLRRKVVIDGKVRMDNNYRDVWADDLWIKSFHRVGYGKHRVRVVAWMGGIRVERIKTVRCDKKPIVEILGPCSDPLYGVLVLNRTSDRKLLVVKLDGRVIVKRWVPKYSRVIVGPFFAADGQDIKVLLDGKLKKSEEAVGGSFGWRSKECRILRAGVQYA